MKITGLPARVAVALTDILALVDASSGVPATWKATVAQLRAAMMPILVGDITIPATVVIPALDVNWASSGVFNKTLAAGVNTFTFSNASSGACIVVTLLGAASSVVWPTVKWPGGTVPTQTASGKDVYTFVHDGTDIVGSYVQAVA